MINTFLKSSIILFSLVGIASCTNSSDSKPTLEKQNTHSILFFDKTQSVNVNDPFVRNKFETEITSILNENVNSSGDLIDVYYIHENTSKAKCLSLNTRTEKENEEGLNVTDLEALNTNYQMSIVKERKLMLGLIIDKMMASNDGLSNAETNVSASVQLISDALSSNNKVKSYFFSDMIESLKNGRDFHKSAPISDDQAHEWADSDVQSKKNMNLTNADITVILPFKPTSSSKENNPAVTEYWRTYFDKLGARKFKEI